MMGETSGLPLPAGKPAAAPATNASAALHPAAAAHAAQPAAAGAAEDAPTDPQQMFDLLLGIVPAASSLLPKAISGKAAAAGDDSTDTTPATDPLQVVLAQVPQLQITPSALPSPMAGAEAMGSAVTAPSSTTTASLSAVITTALPAMPTSPAALFPDQSDLLQSGASIPSSTIDRKLAETRLAGGATPPPSFAISGAQTAPVLADAIAPLQEQLPAAINQMGDLRLPTDSGSNSTLAVTSLSMIPGSHALQSGQAATATTATAPLLQQPVDPGNGYGDGFSGHVAWMAGQRVGHAEIRVVPEHLGVIDIRLQVDGSDVRADFHSSQPEVRQALEASLPRLREMLGQQGLQLAHAGIGHGQSQNQGQGQMQGDGQSPAGAFQGQDAADQLARPGETGSPLPANFRQARGLLDVYA